MGKPVNNDQTISVGEHIDAWVLAIVMEGTEVS